MAAALLAVFSAAAAAAFTMEPMSALLAPSGAKSIATFRVTNDGSARVAIRFSAYTRAVSPEGKETNTPAPELFVLYPSRILVEPGATAVMKMQWKGPSSVGAERCFRLMAEEVPLDSGGEKTSGIKMLFRYVASIYVGEEGLKPELAATARSGLDEGGRPGLFVEIENRGGRHVIANDLGLELADGKGGTIEVKGDELGELDGANFLPGFPRSIFIPREGLPTDAVYAARTSYQSEY
jgi:fimbrial chaperone protein